MANPRVRMVEPPTQARGRTPSISDALVKALTEKAEKGWATLAEDPCPTRKAAQHEAIKVKRHINRIYDDYKVQMRVWEESGGKDANKGEWTWALHVEPENAKAKR